MDKKLNSDVNDIIASANAPEEKVEVAKAEPKPRKKPGKVRIIIDESQNRDDPSHVFMSHNGRSIQIKRGVEVDVDREYVGILNDAVQTIHYHDPQTKQNFTRSALRFPYRVIE